MIEEIGNININFYLEKKKLQQKMDKFLVVRYQVINYIHRKKFYCKNLF
jgi:hypothetical protein